MLTLPLGVAIAALLGVWQPRVDDVNVNATTAVMCLPSLPVVVWIIVSGHVGRPGGAHGSTGETGQTSEEGFATVTRAIASR